MKWTLVVGCSALLAVTGCGSDAGSSSSGVTPEPTLVADGEAFEASFGAVEVTTRWSWALGTTDPPLESGSCGYDHAADAAAAGGWLATFSADGVDPVSSGAYPRGHWTLIADGALPTTPLEGTSSAGYQCSPARDGVSLAPSSTPMSVHLEMVLGVEPDGARLRGYVTRLSASRVGAPVQTASGRPVLLGFAIPAPLLVEAVVEPAPDASGDALAMRFSGSSARDPRFELGLYTGVRGMSASAEIVFRSLLLTRRAR